MGNCCTPGAYGKVFSERAAWKQLKRYRKRGLDRTSRRVADVLRGQSLDGRTLLEIGGGIGSMQVELLRAGLARAVSVELTPTYEAAARELLRETGLEERVERHVMDFAEASAVVEAADFVVLNRVICCYPDLPKLAGAAGDHALRLIVLSFPKERLWTRIAVAIANLPMRLARFRIFVHPVALLHRVLGESGLRPVLARPGLFWEIAAFER